MKKVIFMTGGGGAGIIAAANLLKKTGRYKVIINDMHQWVVDLRFTDKSYILPLPKTKDFLTAIRKSFKNNWWIFLCQRKAGGS